MGVGFPEGQSFFTVLQVSTKVNFYGFTTIFSPYVYTFPFFARRAIATAVGGWRVAGDEGGRSQGEGDRGARRGQVSWQPMVATRPG